MKKLEMEVCSSYQSPSDQDKKQDQAVFIMKKNAIL